MDKHKHVKQECVNKVAGSKNSSVIEKDKYDKVVTYLSESASGDSKFRWWVEKKRCYRLLNFVELGLNNVLCVPAKKQVGLIFCYPCSSSRSRSSSRTCCCCW